MKLILLFIEKSRKNIIMKYESFEMNVSTNFLFINNKTRSEIMTSIIQIKLKVITLRDRDIIFLKLILKLNIGIGKMFKSLKINLD